MARRVARSKDLDPAVAYVGKKIEIPVVFTIFYDSQFPVAWYESWRQTWPDDVQNIIPDLTDGRLVTEESVRLAVDQLNEFYGQHHIAFVLYDGVPDPIRWVDDRWFWFDWFVGSPDASWGADSENLRRAEMALYGVDYPDVLNVFVHMTFELGPLGRGAFPSDALTGTFPWAIDVDFRILPGVASIARPALDPGPKAKDYAALDVELPDELRFAPYNATLIHEVGHCLGLFHTFTDSTPQGVGDMVDDTPFEAGPFFGDGIQRSEWFADFPLDRNTADDSWYWPNHKDPPDPVRNAMEYGIFEVAATIPTGLPFPWDQVSALQWSMTDDQEGTHAEVMYVWTAALKEWNYLALVYDANVGLTWYVNGEPLTPPGPYGDTPPWSFFRLGSVIWWGPNPADPATTVPVYTGLNGLVDELAVYNVAPDHQAVVELMLNGAADGWLQGNYRLEPGRSAQHLLEGVALP